MAGFPTSNDLGSGLSSEVARLDFGVRDLTCFSEGGKARSVRCRHAPDDCLDGAALDGTSSKLPGRETLRHGRPWISIGDERR